MVTDFRGVCSTVLQVGVFGSQLTWHRSLGLRNPSLGEFEKVRARDNDEPAIARADKREYKQMREVGGLGESEGKC